MALGLITYLQLYDYNIFAHNQQAVKFDNHI